MKRAKLSEVIKEYGIRGYNGCVIKDIYKHGDIVNRPIPARIIIGMSDGACKFHTVIRPKPKVSRPAPIEEPFEPTESSKYLRWHKWVYGGESIPPYDTPEWIRLRNNVFKRDKFTCQECKARDDLTAHHVTPRDMGGKDEERNLITLCIPCHNLVEVRLAEPLNKEPDAKDA